MEDTTSKYTIIVLNNETNAVLTISCAAVFPDVSSKTFETYPPDPFGWMGPPLDERKIQHWAVTKEVTLRCVM